MHIFILIFNDLLISCAELLQLQIHLYPFHILPATWQHFGSRSWRPQLKQWHHLDWPRPIKVCSWGKFLAEVRVYKKMHCPIAYFGKHSLDAVQSCQLFSEPLWIWPWSLELTVALKVNRYATDFGDCPPHPHHGLQTAGKCHWTEPVQIHTGKLFRVKQPLSW